MTVQDEATSSSSSSTLYKSNRSRQGHNRWTRTRTRRTKSTFLLWLLVFVLIGLVVRWLIEILLTTQTNTGQVQEGTPSRITALDPQASSHISSLVTKNTRTRTASNHNHNSNSNHNHKLLSSSSTTTTSAPIDDNSRKNNKHCSCWTLPPAPVQCCHRAVVTAHKFGTFLAQDLLLFVHNKSRLKGRWDHSDDANNYKIFQCHSMDCIPPPSFLSDDQPVPVAAAEAAVKDYRHVAMLRNPLEAMVSGYLYHQTGRECTLDYYGAPWRKDLLRDIEQYVQLDHAAATTTTTTTHDPARANQKTPHNCETFIADLPPANQRSLCEYLAQESEDHGMRVYVEYAWNKWYQNLRYYWSAVHANPPIRTLFVCLEDLERVLTQNPLTGTKTTTTPHAVVRHAMLDWLYPGTSHGNNSFASANAPAASYTRPSSNGHATPRDPATRKRLRNLVEQLDQTLLHNELKQLELLFQCGMDE